MTTVPAVERPRPQVLVVDDEPQNLDTFRRVYRRSYDITTAPTGAAGLSLLAGRDFDVVLTDYGMPGMNGAEFVAEARHLRPVAIVMVTGYLDKPEVVDLQQTGALFTVVGKPWDRQTIADVIERASAHTQTLRAKPTPR